MRALLPSPLSKCLHTHLVHRNPSDRFGMGQRAVENRVAGVVTEGDGEGAGGGATTDGLGDGTGGAGGSTLGFGLGTGSGSAGGLVGSASGSTGASSFVWATSTAVNPT